MHTHNNKPSHTVYHVEPSSSSSSSSSSPNAIATSSESSTTGRSLSSGQSSSSSPKTSKRVMSQIACTLPLPPNDTRRYTLIKSALAHIKEHIPNIIEPLTINGKEWRLDTQRMVVKPHVKFYHIRFHFDDPDTNTAFFQRVRKTIVDEKVGGGHWSFNRRGDSNRFYNGIISTSNLRRDAPLIYESFREFAKNNRYTRFTFKEVMFPFYEGTTQFSGIGFNVLRSHLRVLGNLPSSIHYRLHERTRTQAAVSVCKSCHRIIDSTAMTTHQCTPACRHCFNPIGNGEGKDSNGCTKSKCIHRYSIEIKCPRCPDGSNLHDPVACPRIQFTKSTEIDEFLTSTASSKYPSVPNPPSFPRSQARRSYLDATTTTAHPKVQQTAPSTQLSNTNVVPPPSIDSILTPPVLTAIGSLVQQAIQQAMQSSNERIERLEASIATLTALVHQSRESHPSSHGASHHTIQSPPPIRQSRSRAIVDTIAIDDTTEASETETKRRRLRRSRSHQKSQLPISNIQSSPPPSHSYNYYNHHPSTMTTGLPTPSSLQSPGPQSSLSSYNNMNSNVHGRQRW